MDVLVVLTVFVSVGKLLDVGERMGRLRVDGCAYLGMVVR